MAGAGRQPQQRGGVSAQGQEGPRPYVRGELLAQHLYELSDGRAALQAVCARVQYR